MRRRPASRASARCSPMSSAVSSAPSASAAACASPATETLFDQGSIQQTGNPLDLAIQGNGFFHRQRHARRPDRPVLHPRRRVPARQLRLPRRLERRSRAGLHDRRRRARSPLDDAGDLALGARQSPPQATATASMTLNLDSATLPSARVGPREPGHDLELLDLRDRVRLDRRRAPGRHLLPQRRRRQLGVPRDGRRRRAGRRHQGYADRDRQWQPDVQHRRRAAEPDAERVERQFRRRDRRPVDRVQLRRRHRERRHRARRHDAI